MSRKRMISGIVIACVFLLFIVINNDPARINFFWVIRTEMPLSIAVMFSFLLGAFTAMVFIWFKGAKKKDTLP